MRLHPHTAYTADLGTATTWTATLNGRPICVINPHTTRTPAARSAARHHLATQGITCRDPACPASLHDRQQE